MKKLNPEYVKAVTGLANESPYFRHLGMVLSELSPGQALVEIRSRGHHLQYYNALAQKNKGIAELIVQKDLSPQNLLLAISNADTWFNDRAMQAVPENNAAKDIINDILSFYKRS